MVNVRETFLAFLPSLELMTHILTPSVWEAPAEDTHNGIKVSTLFLVCLVADDHCLYKAMNRQDPVLSSFIN